MKTSATIAILLLLIASISQAADLAQQVDRLAKPYIDSETVVGMSIGIIQGDKTVVRGYGKLSADDSRVPDGRTIYEIGSISKVFTGLLLADAVVEGRVSLVTPVEELLPAGFSMRRRDEVAPIRLWHLSTHTSGLPRLPDNLKAADPNPYAEYTSENMAEFLAQYQPRKKPGENMEYSNLGTALLGMLLAADQKTDYATLLQTRIATPLQLDETQIVLSAKQQNRLASPHVDGGAPGRTWDFDVFAGAGGIRSDVDDLLKFAQAQLDPPAGKLGVAIDLAWRIQQQPLDANDFAMGLGWHVAHDGSTRWHSGQTGGYHSSIFVSRKLDAAVVVLANTATGEVDVLAEQLMRMVAGVDEKPREFAKLVEVSPEKMERLTGKYQLAPGAVFTVSVQGNKLLVGLTGQSMLRVYPRSETEWFYKVVDATLTFQVDKSGRGVSVELFQNGVRRTAQRMGKNE
ncbi:serine hydrolase [Blastopirellula marina]|uniref:Beta-lactamase n=1 Tax=Blastopirellula marina DSM 3645 TaxID=314230 RepID=A3ZYW5_9BACT|nr:serine hydrolase [Blastopirellula marina]EAQ78326.1 penicillin-binding protein AmpH, putative [Blastopirellula marina DSM 3645]